MDKNDILRSLRLPVIVAPMFLVSGPELVIASSKAGLIGSFPGPNAKTIEDLESWMNTITSSLNGQLWAFNMIAHNTYDRFQDELDLIAKFKPVVTVSTSGSSGTYLFLFINKCNLFGCTKVSLSTS